MQKADVSARSGQVGSDQEFLIVGRISGLFGVRGWVKVFSYSQPRENILNYKQWYLRQGTAWQVERLAQGQLHGKGVIAQLDGCVDRDAAERFVGCDIAIKREQLAPRESDEFYWADLVGCRVETVDGVELGQVSSLFETGANDVMVVRGERERLLPFTENTVIEVDLEQRHILVDWDPEF